VIFGCWSFKKGLEGEVIGVMCSEEEAEEENRSYEGHLLLLPCCGGEKRDELQPYKSNTVLMACRMMYGM